MTGRRDAVDEIEVTPEMVEAAVNDFAHFDFGYRGEWMVAAVWRASAHCQVNGGQESA